MAKKSEAVSKVEAVEEQKPTVVEDVAAEAKAAVVHESEVAAIKDSRARNLPLFRVDNEDRDYRLLHLLEAKDAAATE